jgi:transcriptional regulator with XRE-family HTH domain
MPSSSSSSAQQARQALADQLRDIRLAAGLTGRELAARAGWHSGSKVSKIEHGARPPSADDVRAWCQVCGVPAERAEELLAEQRAAAGMWVTYQRLNRAGLRRAQESVRAVFEQAALIRSYQPRIIPGLLQTAGYTTVMLEISRDRQGASRDDIAAAVAERMDRQRILIRAGRRFEFVIEEQVLRYRTCATEILREQLRHLHEISRLAQVTLGIIPRHAGRQRVLPSEGFVMFDTGLVIVELVSGVLSVTQPREIAMYTKDFTDLASIAVHGSAARTLISTALHELAPRGANSGNFFDPSRPAP